MSIDYSYQLKPGDAYWWNGRLINVNAVGIQGTRCWNRILGEFNGPSEVPSSWIHNHKDQDQRRRAQES